MIGLSFSHPRKWLSKPTRDHRSNLVCAKCWACGWPLQYGAVKMQYVDTLTLDSREEVRYILLLPSWMPKSSPPWLDWCSHAAKVGIASTPPAILSKSWGLSGWHYCIRLSVWRRENAEAVGLQSRVHNRSIRAGLLRRTRDRVQWNGVKRRLRFLTHRAVPSSLHCIYYPTRNLSVNNPRGA